MNISVHCHSNMLYVLSLLLCLGAFFIIYTDAIKLSGMSQSSQEIIKINGLKHFDMYLPMAGSSYGVGSPFNLPPYDSLPPIPNTPTTPYCVNPPPTNGNSGPIINQPPSPSYGPIINQPTSPSYGPIINQPPSPSYGPIINQPSSPPYGPIIIPSPPPQFLPPIIIPNTPQYVSPNPPTNVPSPTQPIFSPPYYYEPSPPRYVPINPPSYNVPISPPTGYFLPPVVYPPPAVPPPPHIADAIALWCVAKPSVPDPIIQEAMNYACASGADCDQLQPNGSCYQPDTLFAHASYAFNSYWQRTKMAGGTCDFGGTAILVTVDPSFDGCQFIYY
ncbi:hypothetical protein RDI58_029329 [Solanum bulbocastanum]|uniref:X8 domain-containing protein n=1 Tax=Solanum bulbocastanum TaxID=147425 RepID=A0AAN8STD1_SOLBU